MWAKQAELSMAEGERGKDCAIMVDKWKNLLKGTEKGERATKHVRNKS